MLFNEMEMQQIGHAIFAERAQVESGMHNAHFQVP